MARTLWLVRGLECSDQAHDIGLTEKGQFVFSGHEHVSDIYPEFTVGAMGGRVDGCGGFLYTYRTAKRFMADVVAKAARKEGYLDCLDFTFREEGLRLFEAIGLFKQFCRAGIVTSKNIEQWEPSLLRVFTEDRLLLDDAKSAQLALAMGALRSPKILRPLTWRIIHEWYTNGTVGGEVPSRKR